MATHMLSVCTCFIVFELLATNCCDDTEPFPKSSSTVATITV